jgi:hypothetical protein
MATNEIDAWEKTCGKLRLLLVDSAPIDEKPTFNSALEIEELFRVLHMAKAPVALIRLYPPTSKHLQLVLESRCFDIVHFIGHADAEGIQLEREDGASDWVSPDRLGEMFYNSGVKLVVLNSCASEELGDALVAVNIPAVVATSGKVHSSTANLLTSVLYPSLIAQRPIRVAVESAKGAISREAVDESRTVAVALGPKSDKPIADSRILQGDPEFFNCCPVNNLPPDPRHEFLDRTSELLKLYGILSQATSNVIGISGIAGTGKSLLAIAAAWRYGWRFSGGIAYASLRKTKPFSLISLFSHFKWNLESVPESKQLDIVLYELSRSPALIVLDDLEVADAKDIDQIVELLDRWDKGLGGRAILTMRQRRSELDNLVQANWIPVGRLPEDDAYNLLLRRLGGEDAAVTLLGKNLCSVVRSCYCHPKLIGQVAGALIIGRRPWNEIAKQLDQMKGGPVEKVIEMLEETISQVENESPVAGQLLDCWPVFAETASEEAWRFVHCGQKTGSDQALWHKQSKAFEVMQRADILEGYESDIGKTYRVHPLVSDYLRKRRQRNVSAEKSSKHRSLHLAYYVESITSKGKTFPVASEWDNIRFALRNAATARDWQGVLSLCIALAGDDNSSLLAKNDWSRAKEILTNYAMKASQEVESP